MFKVNSYLVNALAIFICALVLMLWTIIQCELCVFLFRWSAPKNCYRTMKIWFIFRLCAEQNFNDERHKRHTDIQPYFGDSRFGGDVCCSHVWISKYVRTCALASFVFTFRKMCISKLDRSFGGERVLEVMRVLRDRDSEIELRQIMHVANIFAKMCAPIFGTKATNKSSNIVKTKQIQM